MVHATTMRCAAARFSSPAARALCLIAWVPLVAGVAAALTGCKSAAPPSKKRPPPLVEVARPEVRDVDVTLDYTVEIKPIEQADLHSKVDGYVERMRVDVGDRVRRGQLLATIRPAALPQQLNQAREQVGQAQAQLALQEQNAARTRELFAKGLVSKADRDNAEAQLAVARSVRGAAKAGVGVAGVLLRETRIVAPFDGWVTQRYLDAGALVTPSSQALAQVMRIDPVRVYVNVVEHDVPSVRQGQEARVTVDALPGRSFVGKVTRFAPALDPVTRTLRVEIQIPNPPDGPPDGLGDDNHDGKVAAVKPGPLKPGMYGRVSLHITTHPKSVVLPVGAVVAEEEERAVFVVEAGHARRVPVTLGFDGGSWLEITSGLRGDEQVIVQGVDLVSDGAAVALPHPEAAPTTDTPSGEARNRSPRPSKEPRL